MCCHLHSICHLKLSSGAPHAGQPAWHSAVLWLELEIHLTGSTAAPARLPHGPLTHLRQARADEHLPGRDVGFLQGLMTAVACLCGISAPLTVEVFCGGALGALLRVALWLAAAQPHAQAKERVAEQLLREGLASAVDAFSLAVPQARAHPLPAPARQAGFRPLPLARRSLWCLPARRSLESRT